MAGALSIIGVLNADLCNVDSLFTKTTFELVERQLRRHVDHLAAVELPPSHPAVLEVAPTPGPSGLAPRSSSRAPADEESSGPSGQYVTALASRTSLDVEEHPSASSIFHSLDGANNDDDQLLESAV